MLKVMKHGDLVKEGDEFNREPWYYCGQHADNYDVRTVVNHSHNVRPYINQVPVS